MRRALLTVPILWCWASAPETVSFKDSTARAGIGSIVVSGGPKKHYVLEVNGSGVCWIDYDNDGWMDLYLVNGATIENLQGTEPQRTTNHLYRNNRNGTFTALRLKAACPRPAWASPFSPPISATHTSPY